MNDRDDSRLGSLDANGFLTDPAHWDVRLAARLAQCLGVAELSFVHWRIIERLRAGWLVEGELPVQRHLCRELDLVSGCVDKLFGGFIEAWKIAGLPDPGEEARVYMENMETDDTITE